MFHNNMLFNTSTAVLLMQSGGIKFQYFLIYVDFKEHHSITASGRYLWQPIEKNKLSLL